MRSSGLFATLLLAACATTSAPDPDATVDARGHWTVVAVNGRATGGGEHFRFVINPPIGSAQFGCNSGSGSLTIGNGWVIAGDWIITVASCSTKRIAALEQEGFEITARPMAVQRTDMGIRLRNERGTIDLSR